MKGTTLKGKCHIVQQKYKVNGFMKTINHNIQVEVGAGNNQFNPNPNEEVNYIKISNRGDLDIKIRLAKDGKESRFIQLSPADRYNGVTIFFTGRDAAAYLREIHEYIGFMINGYYELPRLQNPDYTNDEERFIDENTDLKIHEF